MKMNETMAELLDNILLAIDGDRFDDVVQQLQDFLAQYPDRIDLRATKEIRLIQKVLEYKADLQDWEYFRTLKAIYQYCEETYATDAVCGEAPDVSVKLPDADTIWWCWLQGMDAAPPIVRACFRSLQKLGRKIRVVDENNLADYVKFPDDVNRKRANGQISDAHFSDLLRLELLTTRGGTWVDATVLCTDVERIDNILRHASLFCYRAVMRDGSSEYTTYDNWFLSATRPSAILTDTKRMLYRYWQQEEHIKHYFLFQILFTLATWRHPKECARIPIYSTEPCHVMQMEMLRPYAPLRWQQLCEMSGVHKLTWKYEKNRELQGTMLQHILTL